MSDYLRIGSRRAFLRMLLSQQGNSSLTRRFYARGRPIPPWSGPSRIAIPLLLIAPAIWNGYPLLQYDTGGYLARWYEGYLVPSRSTVFGLYLHFGQGSYFWINLGIQALATLWILQLTLKVFGMRTPFRIAAISLALIATTALPWLASMLLTDIFAGLAVLSLFLLVVHGDKISSIEKWLLFAFTSFAAATHSATLGVLLGLCCAGWMVRPWLAARIPAIGLVRGSLTIVAGAMMLLSGQLRAVGTICVDARRRRCRVRTHAAGRHRGAISERSLPGDEAETVSVSQRASGHRRRLFSGATACSTRSAASRD